MSEGEFPDPPTDMLGSEDFPEPPIDYIEELRQSENTEELIPPHKLPNPVLESRERVRLQNEIKWNSKRGINVLSAKPELQKELDRRNEEKQRRQLAEIEKSKRTSFELKLEQRYNKTLSDGKEQKNKQTELEKIHEKICARPDGDGQ